MSKENIFNLSVRKLDCANGETVEWRLVCGEHHALVESFFSSEPMSPEQAAKKLFEKMARPVAKEEAAKQVSSREVYVAN
jgi:hypothetical protein